MFARKIIAASLTMLFSLSFVACGESSTSTENSQIVNTIEKKIYGSEEVQANYIDYFSQLGCKEDISSYAPGSYDRNGFRVILESSFYSNTSTNGDIDLQGNLIYETNPDYSLYVNRYYELTTMDDIEGYTNMYSSLDYQTTGNVYLAYNTTADSIVEIVLDVKKDSKTVEEIIETLEMKSISEMQEVSHK